MTYIETLTATRNAAYDKATFDVAYYETIALDLSATDKAHDVALSVVAMSSTTQNDASVLRYLDTIAQRSTRSFMSRVYDSIDAIESLDASVI